MDTYSRGLPPPSNPELYTDERLLEFKEKCEIRKVTSFYGLLPHHQDSILRLVRENPESTLYLTGSFAKGRWTDGKSFLKERKDYFNKSNISDLDIVADPIIFHFEDIDFHFYNPTQILIYKDYEFY